VKAFAALLEKLDDRINPIAVKELRQAVQAKYISGVLLLFLVGQLVIMATYVLGRSSELALNAGREVFAVLFPVLAVACLLFVPSYCGSRLTAERSRTNGDLVFLTTLSPWSIVWGKLLTGLAIAMLIYSACMPFLVFTYLLRGVDLPSIFALLVIGFLGTAVAIQIAVFVGCVPANRPARLALGIFTLLFILWILAPLASWVVFQVASRSGYSSGQFWGPLLVALVFGLGVLGHFFVWTVALLSPRWSNRVLPVRIFMFGNWLVTGIGALVWQLLDPGAPILATWAVLGTLVASLALLIAVSERDERGARVARTIPRGGWRLVLAFFFYSGAAGGVALASVMLCTSLLVVIAAFGGSPILSGPVVGTGASAFAASVTARLLRRRVPPKWKEGHTWMVAVSLGFLSLLLSVGMSSMGAFVALNVVWAVGAGLAALPRFVKRADEFRAPGVARAAAMQARAEECEPWAERHVSMRSGPSTSSSKPDPDGIPRSAVRLYKRKRDRVFSFGLRSQARWWKRWK
jgi:hypothetical protein